MPGPPTTPPSPAPSPEAGAAPGMAPPLGWGRERRARLFLAAATGCVLTATLAFATITEDAFITLRVIGNLLDGYGLRWNVDERVQVFTHPLWLLLATPFVVMFDNPRTALASIGVLCTTGAFVLTAWAYRRNGWFLAALVLAPWLGSAALTKYATSGLENSLSHLWVALFSVTWLRAFGVLGGGPTPRSEVDTAHADVPWTRLSLITALAMTNRLDACMLFAPSLLWLVVRARGRLPVGRVLLGALPLLVWLGFATLYYGFPLPNTAYAKLPPSIARIDYYTQGLRYLQELFVHDLVSALWLVLMCLATLAQLAGRRSAPRSERLPIAMLGLGGLLHMAYVIHIGGDYLSGRFWSPTLVLAIQVVAVSAWGAIRSFDVSRVRLLALGTLALVAVACVPRAQRPQDPRTFFHHIQAHAGIHFKLDWRDGWPPHWRPAAGAEFATDLALGLREHVETGGNRVMVVRACGLVPYLVGRDFIPMDTLGLGDPLIARLRPVCPSRFRPGHNPRRIPLGFELARRTGDLKKLPRRLKPYYRELRALTRAPILSKAYRRAFWKIHSGEFDRQLAAYNAQVHRDCHEPILE